MSSLISRVRTLLQRRELAPEESNSRDGLAQKRILDALTEAEESGRTVTLRELHLIIGQPQPKTLRAVAELRAMQRIVVETMLVDPLAGTVRLK